MDIKGELDALMEQDVDYQILRRAFALDRVDAEGVSEGAPVSERSLAVAESLTLSSSDELVIETASFSLDISMTRLSEQARGLVLERGDPGAVRLGRGESETLDLTLEAPPVQTADPLVLDLGGAGITTTGVRGGVRFDLTGDGRAETMSTVTGSSWLLALDRSGNGRIDDGRELFGDQNGAANGFEELARLDSNADGRIDAGDAAFSQLRLLQIKADGSQVTQSLDEAQVVAIELGYQSTRKALNLYDQVTQTASFTRTDGSRGEASDVLLGYQDSA